MDEHGLVGRVPERTWSPDAFHLGEWIVEPSLNRVTRGDRSIHVRRQLIDLVVFLASRRGQVVSKEEIFRAVWPGQFVAEGGLARCISQLRDVFEDDPRAPSLIQTIPTRGYRLLADVQPVGAPAGTPAAVAAPASPSASPPGTVVLDAPAPAARARRRARWWGLAAVLAVAAVVAACLAWRRVGPAPLGERDTLVVAFENRTGDPVFDDTLGLALTVQLEQSPYLRVVSEARLREELAFMSRPPDQPITHAIAIDVCERVGARAVLTGSITSLGDHYVIGVEGAGCASGDTLVRRQLEVDRKESVLAGVGQVASDIRRRLGESVGSIARHDVPLVQATTASLDALKALTAGDLARSRGADAEAIQAYRRAIDTDPAFALAYGRLGVHLLALTRTGEAIDALKRAFALRDRVSAGERLYITSYYYTQVVRDPFKAIDALEAWRDGYPRNPAPRVSLGAMYLQVGRYADALFEGRQALRLEPGDASATAVVVEALMGLERLDEAKRVGEALVAGGRGNASVRLLLLQIAFAQGDADAVTRQTDWAAANPAAESLFATHRAAIAMFGGRMREGARLWEQRAERAEARGDRALAALTTSGAALHAAFVGSTGDVTRLAAVALNDPSTPETVLRCALACALIGEADAADRLLGDYAHMADVEDGSDPEYRAPTRALVEIDRGRPDAAIEGLVSLKPYEVGQRFNGIPAYVRGLAYMSDGRAREAAAEFTTITTHRGVLADALIYPLAWRQLARARAASGDTATARQAYERFLQYWTDADPGMPTLVEARAELARLTR